jgi:hypothetical protein
MSYQVSFTPEVDRRLAAKATASGQDVIHLIQTAVAEFIQREPAAPHNGNGEWSPERDARRCDLIDKDIAETISAAERDELTVLERQANEHFDRIAPPPLDGARRLHQQLLNRRAARD